MSKNPYFSQGQLICHEKQEGGFVNALLVFCVVFMLAIFAFVTFFSRGIVDGDSMLGTLHDEDSLLITRYTKNYQTGDIVILSAIDMRTNVETILVKRIVAVGGQTFMFQKVLVDGGYRQEIVLLVSDSAGKLAKVNEDYIYEPMSPTSVSWQGNSVFEFDTEYSVPSGHYLFLGDNRNDSKDSRYYGFAKQSDMIGKNIYVVPQNSFLMTLLDIFFPAPK